MVETWKQIGYHLHHVIQSYDTAFLKKETADYSAITTWGVFYPDEDSGANLMLLDEGPVEVIPEEDGGNIRL
jgi:hypothetical protein